MADHGRLIVECKQSAAAAAAVLTACSVCSDM